MATVFNHEKLEVYQAAIQFVVWIQKTFENVPLKHSAHDQLDRLATLIALNIAAGNEKYLNKDRCRHYDMARGSALESAAALDILSAKGLMTMEETENGKIILKKVVSMLHGLIKCLSGKRDWGSPSELFGA